MKNLHSNENYLGFEIIRERTNQSTSLQSTYSSCITIGYVTTGSKCIYCNSKQTTIEQNDLFILGIGNYYEENIIDRDGVFEQIHFQITTQRLQQILFSLSINFGISLPTKSNYPTRFDNRLSTIPASEQIRKIFTNINNPFQLNDTLKRIKLNELIYLLATSGDGEIK